MSYRKKSDWGCLGWFLLAFAILALILLVIVLASTPSGGGAGRCESRTNLDRLDRGNSTVLVKWSVATEGVTHISSPDRTTGGSGSKPAPKPVSPVKPGPAPQPVTPDKGQPTKPPQGGSGGSHKAPHIDLDIEDCD